MRSACIPHPWQRLQRRVSGTDLLDCVECGAVAADAGSDDHEVVVEPAAAGRAIPRRGRSSHTPPGGHHLRRGPDRAEPKSLAPETAEAEPSSWPDRVGPGGGGAARNRRRRSRGKGHGRGVHGGSGAEVGAV